MTRWFAALPLVALVLFGGIGLYQLHDGTKPTFERVLRDAPGMAFATLDGGTVRFPELAADHPIAVNLWASWCSPCRAEHPNLIALSQSHPGQLHGLLYDDTQANGRAFLAELGNPFTVIAHDPQGQGGLEFGLTGVPETFVITPDGQITLHVRGFLGSRDLAAVREALGPPAATARRSD